MSRLADKSAMQGKLPVLLLFPVFLGLYALKWYVGYGGYFGNVFGDVALMAAERVQAGDIPYRDFWTMYAPGSFYLLALLFTLFGNHYIVSTIAASALCSAAACLSYLLVFDLLGRKSLALASAAVFFAASYSTTFHLSLGPYPPTIFLVLLALYAMVHFYSSQRTAWLVAAGLATGAAIVFKHDVGGYTAIAITAGLLLAYLPRVRSSVALPMGPVSAVFVYSLAVALVSVPVAAYFAVAAGADMWRDLIVFPATDFHFTRGEHYPELIPGSFHDDWWLRTVFNFFSYLQFTLPFLLFVLALPVILFSALSRKVEYVPIAATFAIAYLFHYGSAHTQINTNVITMALYGTMLGVIVFDLADRRLQPRGQVVLRTFGIAFALVFCAAYASKPLYARLSNEAEYAVLTLPKVSGLRVSPDMRDTLTALVSFVDSHVPAGKKIFVGLHRHDTVVIGDGKLYFILDRHNATRQDQLHPGIVDTARIQKEMIRDLQENDVEYLFLAHIFGDKPLDKLRKIWSVTLPESGATELDSYIRQHYEQQESIGRYDIWVRKKDLPVDTAR